MTARPAATSSRANSGVTPSRNPTNSISGVISPSPGVGQLGHRPPTPPRRGQRPDPVKTSSRLRRRPACSAHRPLGATAGRDQLRCRPARPIQAFPRAGKPRAHISGRAPDRCRARSSRPASPLHRSTAPLRASGPDHRVASRPGTSSDTHFRLHSTRTARDRQQPPRTGQRSHQSSRSPFAGITRTGSFGRQP